MSRFFWGIAQLVNDPPTHIFNLVYQSLTRNGSENAFRHDNIPERTTEPTTSSNFGQIIETNAARGALSISTSPSDITRRNKVLEVSQNKSKTIQVGSGTKKRHHSGTQCKGSLFRKETKTSSVQYMPTNLDRSVGPSREIIKEDAHTNPPPKKICSQHQQVFSLLEKWPRKANEQRNSNLIVRVKSTVRDIVNFLSMEKIENLPQNYVPIIQKNRLYRCASLSQGKDSNEHSVKEKLSKKHRKKVKRNTFTMTDAYDEKVFKST